MPSRFGGANAAPELRALADNMESTSWWARLTEAERDDHIKQMADYEAWRDESLSVDAVRAMSNPPERLAPIRLPDAQDYQFSDTEESGQVLSRMEQLLESPSAACGGGGGLSAAAPSAPAPGAAAPSAAGATATGKSRLATPPGNTLPTEKTGGVTLLPPVVFLW